MELDKKSQCDDKIRKIGCIVCDLILYALICFFILVVVLSVMLIAFIIVIVIVIVIVIFSYCNNNYNYIFYNTRVFDPKCSYSGCTNCHDYVVFVLLLLPMKYCYNYIFKLHNLKI